MASGEEPHSAPAAIPAVPVFLDRVKKNAVTGLASGPNAAALSLHDPFADCQPYASTRIFLAVQPFEYAKDLLGVLSLEANTVVPH